MYHPVAQRRKAKTAQAPAFSSDDLDYSTRVASLLSALDVEADAEAACERGAKMRKRKSTTTRRQPAWNDSTVIRSQPVRPCGRRSRLKVLCRKSSVSCPGGGKRSHTGRRPRGLAYCKYPSVASNREANATNNQKNPLPTPNSCIRKHHHQVVCPGGNFKCQKCASQNCLKRKSVAFQADALGLGQGHYPTHNSQCGKTKLKKSSDASKVLASYSSTCNLNKDRPRSCKSSCNQKIPACSFRTNDCCQQKTGLCRCYSQKLGSYGKANQRGKSSDPFGNGKYMPTRCKSEIFQYLADKHLSKESQYPCCLRTASTPQPMPKSDFLPSERPVNASLARSCPSCKCQQQVFPDSYSSDLLPLGGIDTSEFSKRSHATENTLASKSFSSCKYKDGQRKRSPKSLSFACDSLDACTKAISNLCLKEHDLLEKYGTTASESDIGSDSGCSKHRPNPQTSPRWKSQYTFNEDYSLDHTPSPVSKGRVDKKDWMKKPLSWNQMSNLERNLSDNRFAYSSNRTCGSLGPSGGFSYYHRPYSAFSRRFQYPCSKDFDLSLLRQNLYRTNTPSAELRLFNRYINDGEPPKLTVHSKPSTSPRKRQSESAPETNNSQSNQGNLAKPITPPWRKVLGGFELSKDNSLNNVAPTKKTPRTWATGEALECVPSIFKYKGFNSLRSVPSVTTSIERMPCHAVKSGNGREGMVEKARGGLYGSSYGVPSTTLDRFGAGSVPTLAANTGIFSLLNGASKASFPTSGCPVQNSSTISDKSMMGSVSEWQAGSVSATLPMDTYFKEEEERLRRIGTVIGRN